MIRPTPTTNTQLPYIDGRFETLPEALDYAARGQTGLNFYSLRGERVHSLTYAELREHAIELARRLVKAGLPRGARAAIVAETRPEFCCLFFACQYAGLIPVPLPLPVNLGGRAEYVQRLARLIGNSGALVAVASADFLEYVQEAIGDLPVALVGTPEDIYRLPAQGGYLRPLGKDELCYIQYSSGSTRFPLGVTMSQRSVSNNCRAILLHGLDVGGGDRGVSWLPFYHDMGLVGFFLTPVLGQISIDYIATPDFARRPLLWLRVLSANGGTLSFSPTFGYDLCHRRAANGLASSFDLRSWRVAGVGGEMIRPDVLAQFADTFAGSGFRRTAFLASYGLAEATLAVTFAPLERELQVDRVDKHQFSLTGRALPAGGNGASAPADARSFVKCGRPLPDHEVEVRDKTGKPLPERRVGEIYVRGPSVMAGYFGDRGATARTIDEVGWLQTGDMGYMVDGSLVITGRSKDLIICNGRNIWPQDIEWAVERLPGLRPGDAAAFSTAVADGTEAVVVIAQCGLSGEESRRRLQRDIAATVRTTAGVDCQVVLVPPRSLPHTSSGKLSRSSAKAKYLAGMYVQPLHGEGA